MTTVRIVVLAVLLVLGSCLVDSAFEFETKEISEEHGAPSDLRPRFETRSNLKRRNTDISANTQGLKCKLSAGGCKQKTSIFPPESNENQEYPFSGEQGHDAYISPSQNVSSAWGRLPKTADAIQAISEEEMNLDQPIWKSSAQIASENDRDITIDEENFRSASDASQARFIGYAIQPSMPVNTTASTSIFTANYPTITLAQLARQIIFPNWLWTRFSATRKTGLGDLTVTTTKGTVAPTIKPTTAAITYDNNLTRFLRLFTFVRFQNTACVSSAGQNGTCYTSHECSSLGGTGSTTCANGFGVCCVFEVRCGGSTNRNGTYFVSTGIVFSANQIRTCTIQILKASTSVHQIRLDLRTFTLRQPVAGSCESDRFVVSGQNTNNIIPILCGQNSGSHIYVETSDTASGIQISIQTTGEGVRSWNIQVTQYDAANRNRAPSHCLQYYTGVMGTIRSFNYISDTSPQYLNNLNYAICIRREAGFCSITYSNLSPSGTYQPFQIVNANAEGALIIPSGQAGLGVRNCPYDFILINGVRLCGERLNDGTTNILIVNDAPITDTSNGPFTVMVRTNEIDVGGGFNIYYRQNPCLSAPG